MKIILKDVKRGIIKAIIDDNEDFYYLEKIVSKGDIVKSLSFRKIKKGSKEEVVKKKFVITIRVEETSFESGGLRFKGKIIESNSEDVPLNSYHSISAAFGSRLTIKKKKLGNADLEILKKAGTAKKVIGLSVVDYGEAHFGLLLRNEIKRLGSFEENIRERDVGKTDENKEKFVKNYIKKLEEFFESYKPETVIIGSIGFVGEKVLEELPKKLGSKVRFCKVSNTTPSGLSEIVKRGEVDRAVLEEEVTKESRIIEDFFARIAKNSTKVCYGMKNVREKAVSGAVDEIIVSDELLKKNDVRELIDSVESFGGKIEIISSKHDKGEEFLKFGGLGAILRY